MECFNHVGAPSVAACEECHKHLCRICAVDLGSFVLCPTCFSNFIAMQEQHIRSLRRRFIVGIVLVVLFVLPYVRGIGSFSDLIELLLLALWILSFPISLYMMRGAPDPYVPTSFSAAGNLALFHWFAAIMIFLPLSRAIKPSEKTSSQPAACNTIRKRLPHEEGSCSSLFLLSDVISSFTPA